MRIILVVCDGMGDRPIEELGCKTPLEAANKPNLDRLAAEGITGLMNTIDVGVTPGSDTAHLSILGYDLERYYCGRGPMECAGLRMDLRPGDVAFRANAGTVDANWVAVDRRAGRISDTGPFADALDGIVIDGVKFIVKKGTGHRMGVVMRGKGLSAKINDPDPHETGVKIRDVKPLDGSASARKTAKTLAKFLVKSHEILKRLDVNTQRVKDGKPPANFVLMRGAGLMCHVPSFQEKYGLRAACIAGAGLYKGVGAYLGMDVLEVEGATGMGDTNIVNKFKAAKDALKNGYDFVFVHVKWADSLGEDGKFKEKKEFIERIDSASAELIGLEDTLVAITADHSTPCALKKHSGDPVPLLIHGPGVRVDDVCGFGERPCARGGIGRIRGIQLIPELVNLAGKSHLIGA